MTARNRKPGGKSGRRHEEHLPKELLDEICAISKADYPSSAAAESAARRLRSLFQQAGITSRSVACSSAAERCFKVTHESSMEHFDVAVLLYS